MFLVILSYTIWDVFFLFLFFFISPQSYILIIFDHRNLFHDFVHLSYNILLLDQIIVSLVIRVGSCDSWEYTTKDRTIHLFSFISYQMFCIWNSRQLYNIYYPFGCQNFLAMSIIPQGNIFNFYVLLFFLLFTTSFLQLSFSTRIQYHVS